MGSRYFTAVCYSLIHHLNILLIKTLYTRLLLTWYFITKEFSRTHQLHVGIGLYLRALYLQNILVQVCHYYLHVRRNQYVAKYMYSE